MRPFSIPSRGYLACHSRRFSYKVGSFSERLRHPAQLSSSQDEGQYDKEMQPIRAPISTSAGTRVAVLEPHDDEFAVEDSMQYSPALSREFSAETNDDLVLDEEQAGNRSSTVSAELVGKADMASVPVSLRKPVQQVTEHFKYLARQEQERRERILYNLTHPNPADYTFDGKLVPMPPLNFGTPTDVSYQLAEAMIVNPEYSLVRQAQMDDYFFEINDLFLEVAFVGKANAGKSSLVNALLGQPGCAKTSTQAHSTRKVNFYQACTPEQLEKFRQRNPTKLVKLPGGGVQFTFVDLPGWGLEGMSDTWREHALQCNQSYLGCRRSINTVFMCIDATSVAGSGISPSDERLFTMITNSHGLFWIILTKCDLVSHSNLIRVIRTLYQRITSRDMAKRVYPLLVPVSSAENINIDYLRAIIVESSGVVPGDVLRDQMRREAGERLQRMHALEQQRLRELAEGNMYPGAGDGCPNGILASAGKSNNMAMRRIGRPGDSEGGCIPHINNQHAELHNLVSAASRAATSDIVAAVADKATRVVRGGNNEGDIKVATDTVVSGVSSVMRAGLAKEEASSPVKCHTGLGLYRTGVQQGSSTRSSTPDLATVEEVGGTGVASGIPKKPSGGRVTQFIDAVDERRAAKTARQRELEARHGARYSAHRRLHKKTPVVFVGDADDTSTVQVSHAGVPVGKKLSRRSQNPRSRERTRDLVPADAAGSSQEISAGKNNFAPWDDPGLSSDVINPSSITRLERTMNHGRLKAAEARMSRKEVQNYNRNSGRVPESTEWDQLRHGRKVARSRMKQHEARGNESHESAREHWDGMSGRLPYNANPDGLMRNYGMQARQIEHLGPESNILGL